MIFRDPRRRSYAAPVLSGLLFAYAYMGGWWIADVLFLLPLLGWLDDEEDPVRRRWGGFVFGAVAYGVTMHYHIAMAEHSWLAWPLWFGFALAEALKTSVLFAWATRLKRRSNWSWAVVLPPVWISAEWVTQHLGDLRMTGDHLSHAVSGAPYLIQFAEWTGPYGVAAGVLLTNAWLHEAMQARWKHARRTAWIALAVLWTAGGLLNAGLWMRASRAAEAAPTVKFAALQPNVPLAIKHDLDSAAAQTETLRRMSEEAAAAGASWVVWPESSRPYVFYEFAERPETRGMPEVEELAGRLGVSILVGAEHAEVAAGEIGDYTNGAFLVWPDGALQDDWGGKVYLVPFTEALPFRGLFGPLVEGRGGEWDWVAGGFDPAPRSALLRGPNGVRMGVLVCYEEFFSELSDGLRERGANVQAVITNDAWFGRTFLQRYLNNAVRLRAIENRTAFVRAANTGISSLIDPVGRVTASTGLFEEAVIVGELPLLEASTVYNRIGDVPAYAALAALAAMTIGTWRRRSRT